MRTRTKFTLPTIIIPSILYIFTLFSFSQENEENYKINIPEFHSPPKIDGKLENPLWEKAAIIDTFTQFEPQEGASPSENTLAYIGYKTSFGITLTLKPLTNLRLLYDFKNVMFDREKGGEKDYEINIISQRINYQISRPLSLRLITDYDDYEGELYTSILLSYELRPGTVFYFRIDDNQERGESGIFRRAGRYYFIKFSYLWRI